MATKREIRIPELAPPVSHYTDAVRAGDFVFISGMAALDAHGNILAPGDVSGQTRHALEAIGSVLRSVGAAFGDIVKVTVYLKDIADRPRINPVRQEFFGDSRPASVLVEVSDLFMPGLLVEIDAIAYVPQRGAGIRELDVPNKIGSVAARARRPNRSVRKPERDE